MLEDQNGQGHTIMAGMSSCLSVLHLLSLFAPYRTPVETFSNSLDRVGSGPTSRSSLLILSYSAGIDILFEDLNAAEPFEAAPPSLLPPCRLFSPSR